LTNFPNGKQTQESLESGFPENEFRETNMALELLGKDMKVLYVINLFLTGVKNSYDPFLLSTLKGMSMSRVGVWQCAKPRHVGFGTSQIQRFWML
jgi:hypothetical protein